MIRFALALACLASPVAADITWQPNFYDRGRSLSQADEPDLILPMPCGGAMAFQRVDVFVDGNDRLSDKALRHGESSTQYGYRNYLRREHLRGPFQGNEPTKTYFFLARYELTELQYSALTDPDCGFRPSAIMTVPKTGVSWFEAQDISRIYTEWLLANAPDSLPEPRDGGLSYLRLPTEAEWEFATRGGETVDDLDYTGLRHPMDENLSFYAQFGGDGTAPVGTRAPNPLGLFDMLGNVEEMMLEPFRLNALGHTHGQIGGMVTRGGSYLSEPGDLTSAARTEWSFYNTRRGTAQAPETVGFRLVIGATALGRTGAEQIGEDWRARFEGDPDEVDSPITILIDMIDESIDPTQTEALETVVLDLATAEDAARTARASQLNATLELATTTLSMIRFQGRRAVSIQDRIDKDLADIAFLEGKTDQVSIDARDQIIASMPQFEALLADVTQSIRNQVGAYARGLNLLADAQPAEVETAFTIYRSELESRNGDEFLDLLVKLRDHLDVLIENQGLSADALIELALRP
ncbi:SUMF1/EgtB/PvdO family nonheme iron enzyme [Yoonia sp. SS1-5]|uniref:Formylglycine-generating enzyme family protein n=1 Tax=Yoonia rhodophyticola TaxID=3137370 RepID=A0AAN0MLV5_9RHOB